MREILRRLLLVVGALIATAAGIACVIAAAEASPDERLPYVFGPLACLVAFFAYRATVNWVLLFEDASPPKDQ